MKLIFAAAYAGLSLTAVHARAQDLGDAKRGAIFAQTVCADCHAVKKGQIYSTNPKAPTFDQISAMPGMTSAALHVWFVTAHPTMPDLLLGAYDKDDLVAYILSLKSKQ
jgi:hypothetical protein